jgi:hypothetical protein
LGGAFNKRGARPAVVQEFGVAVAFFAKFRTEKVYGLYAKAGKIAQDAAYLNRPWEADPDTNRQARDRGRFNLKRKTYGTVNANFFDFSAAKAASASGVKKAGLKGIAGFFMQHFEKVDASFIAPWKGFAEFMRL